MYNKTKILVISLLFLNNNLLTQTIINEIGFYKTMEDFKNDNPIGEEYNVVLKSINESSIHIKKVINSKSGKKVKKITNAWAIKYKGEFYFNLGYSTDLNNWKLFIKLDYVGKRYCYALIDKNTPKSIKNSGTNYGGGLSGVLMKDSNKWNKNWSNENNEKVKILLIDFKKNKFQNGKTAIGSRGNLLKRKDVKKKFKVNLPLSEIKNIKLEEILEIIHQFDQESQ